MMTLTARSILIPIALAVGVPTYAQEAGRSGAASDIPSGSRTGVPSGDPSRGASSTPADEPDAASDDVPNATAQEETDSRYSLDLSIRYESDYFFRGLVQRSDAFNVEPSATLSYEVFRDEAFTLTAKAGIWNAFTDERASGATGSFGENWYEADLFAGVSLSYDRITLDAIYTWYLSPASDFASYEDITLTLGFDDSGLWEKEGRFAINPSASVALETRGAADGADSGAWLGLGVKPSYAVGETFLGPLTLAAPVGVGLSLSDYYQGPDGDSDTFGFFEVGLTAAFDLSERWGDAAPTLETGVKYLLLDGVTRDFNAGDENEFIWSVGLSWSF